MNDNELEVIYQEDENRKYERAQKIEEEYRTSQIRRYEKYQKKMNEIEQEINKKSSECKAVSETFSNILGVLQHFPQSEFAKLIKPLLPQMLEAVAELEKEK